MRAIILSQHGVAGAFELRETDALIPAAGQVLIAVRAAGVNFADILARQGIYPACPPLPCVIGYEVAGEVLAVGEGVNADLVGQRVMALTDFGGYAEQALVKAAYVWPMPVSLSFEQAAAIPLNYITAWGLLVAMGGLQSGETVLIHNAGGGVGLAAIDIARHKGALVIGTASPGKHDRLRERGLDHAVDYRKDDWDRQVLELTGGRGVELAIDPVGGSQWRRTFAVLRKTGRMGMFGISSASAAGLTGKFKLLKLFAAAPFFHPARLIPGNRGVFGINIHAMYEEHAKLSGWMAEMLPGVEQSWLRPHVDRSYSFADVAAAHAYIEARQNLGKVVLVP